MTTFTLIAYRSNHEHYYGNDYDCSSNSDFEIKESKSLDEIVKECINYNFNEKSAYYSNAYAEWELTLLIDGRQESYDETELSEQDWAIRHLYENKVEEGIILRKQEIIEEQKRAEEQRLVQQEQKRIAAEEERLRNIQKLAEAEKALFFRLKEKYKDLY